MMATGDIAALGGTLLQLVNTIQHWGNNYYKASAAWHDFPQQVSVLRAKHTNLEAHLERYGLLEYLNPLVLLVLNDAKKLMLEEVETLQKRRARDEPGGWSAQRISTWFGKLGEVVFPEKVGIAMQRAIKAYEDAEGLFKSQQEHDQMMRIALKTSPVPLSFGQHCRDHYVPLECESRVYSALKESGPNCATVVLLYGGSGRGKSTVARQISLTFQKDKSMFAHVLILECGFQIDAQAKETELLQKLGWDYLNEMSEQYSDHDLKPATHGRLQNQLQLLLQRQKLLIVLDDLWESNFLQRLLNLSGPEVKYLITSQQKDLCKTLTCTPKHFQGFQVDNLQQDQSRRMLAIHIGFPDERIPDHLQDMADKIIDKAEGIPLVIATLGAQIGKAGDDADLEVWKCALENYTQCLNQMPLKSIDGNMYPRSYWSALQQSIDGLSPKEKYLFLLMGTSRGSSTPQHILQFFCSIVFSKEDCNLMQFSQWKSELKGRHLVFEKKEKWLSIHSLTKKLLVEYMGDTLGSMVQSFFEMAPNSLPLVPGMFTQKTKVIIYLVCLYLDAKFGEPVALQAGLTYDKLGEVLRRTVEPITKLLVLDIISSRTWTGEIHICARQVFLEFICNNALDHHHILRLLDCSAAITYTLKFLQNASLLEGFFWQKNVTQSIPYSILKVFQDKTHPDLQVQAGMTLAALCNSHQQTCNDIVNTHGMLHQVINSLSQDQSCDLQVSAALFIRRAARTSLDTLCKILCFPEVLPKPLDYPVKLLDQDQSPMLGAVNNLTSPSNSTTKCIVACFPNLLHNLIALLSKGQNSTLQTHVAAALANLGLGDESIKRSILKVPKVLDKLVKAMHQDQNSDLAQQATRATRILATIQDSTIKGEIASFPNLLESLGASLSNDQNPALQTGAAGALANLANLKGGDESTKANILKVPRLLDNLVELVHQDQNSGLAQVAARTICNLGDIENFTIKSEIACFPNLLNSLGASLSNNGNPTLQTVAIGALANLGCENQSTKANILKVPGLLDNLVKSMHQDQNCGLVQEAARATRILAAIEDFTIKSEIACFPNLLESLASLLNSENPTLQTEAAAALANLGCENQSTKATIQKVPGLLDNLVKLVQQDQHSVLAQEAARAIRVLAAIEDFSIKSEISCFPNLLESLGALLLKSKNSILQREAVVTLARLGYHNQSTSENILKLPGLLNNLVKLVHQDQNLCLAQEATRAIHNLIATRDSTSKGKITCFPNLLESLVASLSKSANPILQTGAATTLANLGYGDQSAKANILKVPGLLDKLVQSICQDQNSGLAQEAARVFCNLTTIEDSNIHEEIASFPYLLESLRASLLKSDNSILQTQVAATLANLAYDSQSTKRSILKLPGLVDNLVKAMHQDQNSCLATEATRAIHILTATRDLTSKFEGSSR